MSMERKMKDSEIPWIGMIPEEWRIGRVKEEYVFQTGATPPTKDESNFDGENKWVAISDINGKFISETNKHLSDDALQLCSMDISPKGSLLYSFKLSVGQVAFLEEDMYTNEAIASFLPIKGHLPFLYYASFLIEYNANTNIYGAKLLNQELIKNALIVLPPLSEQLRIAAVLDAKCGEIDELIGVQEEMISELTTFRQSVITEAVTRGLTPNATLRPTNIPWLPEIPEHWEMKPVKAIFNKRNEKNNPVKSEERLSLSIGLGITRYADKTTNLDRFKDDFTQYQLAYPNDIVLNSMNMIVGAVGKSEFFGCVSPVYYVVTPKNGNNSDYYGHLLNTPKIRQVYHSLGRGIYAIERGEGRVNTCRLKVPYYDFSIISIPVPPLAEQDAIAEYLDTKTTEIDELIALKREKIAELKEYRKSLIFEYVTGKHPA